MSKESASQLLYLKVILVFLYFAATLIVTKDIMNHLQDHEFLHSHFLAEFFTQLLSCILHEHNYPLQICSQHLFQLFLSFRFLNQTILPILNYYYVLRLFIENIIKIIKNETKFHNILINLNY